MKKYLLYLFRIAMPLLIVCAGDLAGQTIWTNPITGSNPNTANPYTYGQIFDLNMTVSGIGRGPGILGANADNRYNATSWNTPSLDPDAYFYFTVTPNPGYKIDFASFVYTGQASGTGPTSVVFRSSADSYGSDIGAASTAGTTIDLSVPAYQGVTSPITFRIYAWGASAAGGTFSINDFTFNGTVSSTGVSAEPGDFPTNFTCGTVSDSSISVSWTDAAGATPPGGYLIKWSSVSYAAITEPIDGVPEMNGSNISNVLQGVQNYTVTGLAPDTISKGIAILNKYSKYFFIVVVFTNKFN